MVLYPINDETEAGSAVPSDAGVIPAWQAVERQQKRPAQEWWLVTQPGHAALSGDLAANLDSPLLPKLDSTVIRAIALHDSGWARYDGGERGTGHNLEVGLRDPELDSAGRPLSFLEMAPDVFLTAWTVSIEQAEKAGAIGGVIVSQHFCWLAESRLDSRIDDDEAAQRLRSFVSQESQRQERLLEGDPHSANEVAVLTDILQFCDLLSLYLCCGARNNVEFPQKFQRRSPRLIREGELVRILPSMFGGGVSLAVTARGYPRFGAADIATLPFLIA